MGYILVLSASPVISRNPVLSKILQNTPCSASREPGCAVVSIF